MTDVNPYQSPHANVAIERSVGTGARVYRIGHIGLATFLGTPAAGAWLMASNYVALGAPEKRIGMLWLGIGATIFLLVMAYFLPVSVPALPFNIAVVIGMLAIGNSLQGKALQAYAEDGALWHSSGRAAGIGLLFGLAMAALILAIIFVPVLFGYDHFLD